MPKAWKAAEMRTARFHNPHGGGRAPLSGGGWKDSADNTPTTKSDAVGLNGIFLETKQRKDWSLWTLYRDTAALAKKEKNIPVVSIFKKGANGFIDLIHSNFIDEYIRIVAANRRITIDGHTVNKIVGGKELAMHKLFSGPMGMCVVLSNLIRPSCFRKDGTMVPEWWKCAADDPRKLDPFAIVPDGYQYAIYGWIDGYTTSAPQITEADIAEYQRRER